MTDTPIVRPSALRAAGATEYEAKRAVRHLSRLAPGSYGSVAGLDHTQTHLLRMRAVLEGRGSVVASHATAALAHRLPVPRHALDRIHVSPGPGLTGRPKSSVRVRVHARRVERGQIADLDGLRVTDPLRTVLDLPQIVSLDWAVAAADAAVHAGAVPTEVLTERCLATRRINAAARIRAMGGLVSGLAESPGESILRLRMRSWGWEPVEQVALPWVAGRPRVDFLVDGVLVVEFDGAAKYELDGDVPLAHLREKARNEALGEAGFELIHVRWAHLWEDVSLRRRMEAALRRARSRPTPAPW